MVLTLSSNCLLTSALAISVKSCALSPEDVPEETPPETPIRFRAENGEKIPAKLLKREGLPTPGLGKAADPSAVLPVLTTYDWEVLKRVLSGTEWSLLLEVPYKPLSKPVWIPVPGSWLSGLSHAGWGCLPLSSLGLLSLLIASPRSLELGL